MKLTWHLCSGSQRWCFLDWHKSVAPGFVKSNLNMLSAAHASFLTWISSLTIPDMLPIYFLSCQKPESLSIIYVVTCCLTQKKPNLPFYNRRSLLCKKGRCISGTLLPPPHKRRAKSSCGTYKSGNTRSIWRHERCIARRLLDQEILWLWSVIKAQDGLNEIQM